jgi:hypothetical protein
MGKPRPTAFKPGKSGNPNGRPKLAPELITAKALTKEAAIRWLNEVVHANKDELNALMNDPSTPGLKLMMASVIAKGVKFGDYQRLNFMLDRLIGKIPEADVVESTGIKVMIEDYSDRDQNTITAQATSIQKDN